MRKVLVIAAREYKAAVKTKSFIIGILLMPVMMGGGFLAILFADQIDTRPKHFAIVDHTGGGQFFAVLDAATKKQNEHAVLPGRNRRAPMILENVSPSTEPDPVQLRLALSERVRKSDLTGFLEIGPDIVTPPPPATESGSKDAYSLRYQTNRPAYEDFAKWAQAVIQEAVRLKRGEAKGIAPEDLKTIDAPVALQTKGLTKRDERTGEIIEGVDQNPIVATLLPGGLVILMFMMIVVGAAPLLQGVMEEKMQRIAEVLLGSVEPFPLMMGKITGMTLVSLTMTAIYLGGAFWAAWSYGYAEYLSPEVVFWFLTFQILALFLFGSIYAAVGAACTDLKEAQTMLMPVSLLAMLPIFVWINVVREPTSTFAVTASYIPLFTPMLMIARVSVPPGIPWWQPTLGAIGVFLFMLLCVYAAGRIFRVGILMQGKGARFSDLWRWIVRG